MFFNWMTINVTDMDRSLAFYRDLLKLPVVRTIGDADADMHIVFLGEEGKTQYELIRSKTAPQPSETITAGFTPDNLEEILEACKDSATQAASGRFWFVKDPDGYRVQLMVK